MKKTVIILLYVMLSQALHAQKERTYTQMFDSLLINVQQTDASTGILYDRVVSFAGLHHLNATDTVTAGLFIQAYSELYRAAFMASARLPFSVEDLEKQAQPEPNIVNIGLLHYRFNVIDSAVAVQKLYFDADSILQENKAVTASLYREQAVFIAAPLAGTLLDSLLIFRFDSQLQFDNTGNPIVQLEADFGDGNGLQPVRPGTDIQVQYAHAGTYALRFVATLSSGLQMTARAKVNYKGSEENDINYALVESKPIYSIITPPNSYEGGNFAQSEGTMWTYYAHVDETLQKPILRKPILIADGFDPGNVRTFDSYRGTDPSGKSIWNLLAYNNNTDHIGTQLRDLGYDLVILDFPDGGGYIERNAMICIQAINDINTQLQANGSKEQIVIVGPSMGGQITRYALAYMEQHPDDWRTNNGRHNCRLWISYDSPHQGANISLGGQAFMHFFGSIGELGDASKVWNGTINCPAAKQMLIKQYIWLHP